MPSRFERDLHEGKLRGKFKTLFCVFTKLSFSLAYARRLFDSGNTKGAFYYCDQADEKGGMLRKELEALDARTLDTDCDV